MYKRERRGQADRPTLFTLDLYMYIKKGQEPNQFTFIVEIKNADTALPTSAFPHLTIPPTLPNNDQTPEGIMDIDCKIGRMDILMRPTSVTPSLDEKKKKKKKGPKTKPKMTMMV